MEDWKKATFSAVAYCIDRDRDRVGILHLEDDTSGETSLGPSVGHSQTISGDVGRCSVVRMIEGCESGEYCEEKEATSRVIGVTFTADGEVFGARIGGSGHWAAYFLGRGRG